MMGKFFSDEEEEENYPDVDVKYKIHAFGLNGLVLLTEDQYYRLAELVDDYTLQGYIYKLDFFLVKPEGHIPHNHYKTIRRWIEEDFGLD